jgi:hypothetical protein
MAQLIYRRAARGFSISRNPNTFSLCHFRCRIRVAFARQRLRFGPSPLSLQGWLPREGLHSTNFWIEIVSAPRVLVVDKLKIRRGEIRCLSYG